MVVTVCDCVYSRSPPPNHEGDTSVPSFAPPPNDSVAPVGKLSYTYWRVFEKYDQAWGLTEKYKQGVLRLSKEAMELDRQYKIRAKALRYTPRRSLDLVIARRRSLRWGCRCCAKEQHPRHFV